MKKKELNYYDEIIKSADIACKMSSILQEHIRKFNYDMSGKIEEEIHKYENEADDNMHRVLSYLVKDFLPPIDREDIVALVNKIDDMIDAIDELVINMDILDIRGIREDFIEFIILIDEMCKNQIEMIREFKEIKKYDEIHKFVVNLNNLEEKGDRLFEKSIKELFQIEKNSIEVLKWNTLYNCAENCFDSIENVANCVDEIMMKNV